MLLPDACPANAESRWQSVCGGLPGNASTTLTASIGNWNKRGGKEKKKKRPTLLRDLH
jgi:hypothetical protein